MCVKIIKMIRLLGFCAAVFAASSKALALPGSLSELIHDVTSSRLQLRHSEIFPRDDGDEARIQPAINADFPDPCIVESVQGTNRTFYAFATNGNGRHIQVASSSFPLDKWTLHRKDALPGKGWTTGKDYWAPDVRQLDDGSWIMYFSGQTHEQGRHCIGVARSETVDGPYTMDKEPLICPLEDGGAIDPFLFVHEEKHYVAYKVDGNRLAADGPTPLLLQRVKRDGSKIAGKPITLLGKRVPSEGRCIEAPYLRALEGGGFALFYSSHTFKDERYDVRVAFAERLEGPYRRADRSVLRTGDWGLTGPGGWQAVEGGLGIGVFHGWCREKARCMYVTPYKIT